MLTIENARTIYAAYGVEVSDKHLATELEFVNTRPDAVELLNSYASQAAYESNCETQQAAREADERDYE